jgi:xanthine/uracil permease
MQYIIAMFFGRVSVPRLVCIAMEALGNPVDTLISVTVVADPVDLPP